MSDNKIVKVEPVAVIYKLTKQDGSIMSTAQRINKEPLNFDVLFVSGACVTLFDTFLNTINEQQQNVFEDQFKELFQTMFDKRHNYMEIMREQNFTDGL